MMTRCQKLYQVKTDAQKILQLFIKIALDPAMAQKSNADQARCWGRIASLIGSFETEHHVYHKFYFDGYDLKTYAETKEAYLKTGMAGCWKIPTIGQEQRRPPSPGYMAREVGFENSGGADDDEYGELTLE